MASVLGEYLSLVSLDPAGAGAVSTRAMNGSGLKTAWIFQPPADITVDTVGIVCSGITGTSPSYKIGLQLLTSAGVPDGTYLSSGNAMHVQQLASGWNAITLDATASLTRGVPYALVVEYDSGTINGSNLATLRYGFSSFYPTGIPYAATHNGASWSKDTGTQAMFYGLGASGVWYERPTLTTSNVLVNTANHRSALKFTLPSGSGTTFQVLGLRAMTRPCISSTSAYRFGIWNAAGTELQGCDLDMDHDGQAGNAFFLRKLLFAGALATLNYGTTYYIGFGRTGGVQTGFDTVSFNASAQRDAVNNGITGMATWDTSTWSDNNTNLPIVADLILADMTATSGGGINRAALASGLSALG